MLAEPGNDRVIHMCVVKAVGAGRDGATHTTARPIQIAPAVLDAAFAGLASADSKTRV
jgi:hypothetical protein